MNKKGNIYLKKINPQSLFIFLGAIFIFLIILSVNIVSVTSRGVVGDIEKGLIGHWPLNGTYDTKDITPYGNHGINNSATLASGIKGEGNGSYSFNGTNSYIKSTNTVLLNSNQTYSVWVYPNSVSGLRGLLTTHRYTNTSNIGINQNNSKFSISIGYTDGTREYSTKTSNYSITANKWVHVALAYNSTENSVSLYVNGILDNKWILTKTVKFVSDNILLGQWSNNYVGNYVFLGSLNDARVYNRVLSSDEIRSLYEMYKPSLNGSSSNKGLIAYYPLDKENEGNGGVVLSTNFSSGSSGWGYTSNVNWSGGKPNMNGTASDSYIITSANMFMANKTYRVIVDCTVTTGSALASPQSLTSSAILLNHTGKYEYTVTTPTDQRFLIDNISNTDVNMTINSVYISEVNINNTTPYKKNGAVSGATLNNNRFGASYGSYSFDGVDDYINIGDSARLSSGGTISVWIKPSSAGENLYGRVIDKSTSTSSSNGYLLSLYGDKNLGISINGADPVLRADNVIQNYNQWYHIVAVLASTKKEIWVNGVLVASNTNSSLPPNTSGNVYIGNRADNTDRTFSGSISDLKIYDRILSADEIKSLYDSFDSKLSTGTLNKGLILNMPLTDSYMKSSSVVSDATPYMSYGTLINSPTISEEGASFTGLSDRILVKYANQFNLRSAITISVWMKRNTVYNQNTDVHILSRYPSWYFYDSYSSGLIRGEVYIDGARKGGVETPIPFDSNWYNVVYSYDSSTHISKIYRNGTLYTSTQLTGLSNYLIDLSNADFSIGSNSNSLARGITLSGLKMWNRSLTNDEVKLLYDKGRN